MVAAVWMFSTIEQPWACAHTVEGEGGCIYNPWAVGAGAFGIGV